MHPIPYRAPTPLSSMAHNGAITCEGKGSKEGERKGIRGQNGLDHIQIGIRFLVLLG